MADRKAPPMRGFLLLATVLRLSVQNRPNTPDAVRDWYATGTRYPPFCTRAWSAPRRSRLSALSPPRPLQKIVSPRYGQAGSVPGELQPSPAASEHPP